MQMMKETWDTCTKISKDANEPYTTAHYYENRIFQECAGSISIAKEKCLCKCASGVVTSLLLCEGYFGA